MKASSGQILVEILISAIIFIFVSLSVAYVSTTSLRAVPSSAIGITASFLGKEEGEALRAIVRENWANIRNLATTSANKYYTYSNGSKWLVSTSTGTETVTLNAIPFTRYFYLDEVYRSTSTSPGDIVGSGGYYDPSTIKATVIVSWTDNTGYTNTASQTMYLSRFLNATYAQTNWAGGAVGDVVVTSATTTFATSSGVTLISSSSIILSSGP